jgi:hypothetical protein
MRDHNPILIEEFNGLWRRGDAESCPLDHFSDCDNLMYIQSGFRTRDGIDVLSVGTVDGVTIPNIVRMYTFVHNDEEGLLVLDTLGNIFHTKSPTPFIPILTITGMVDFAFVGVANRAYICPHDGILGMKDEFLYVYLGDGSLARKAAGPGPILPEGTGFTATSGGFGEVEPGIHIFAVVYETNTGFLTQLGPIDGTLTKTDSGYYQFATVTVSGGAPYVVARHIVATKAINPTLYNSDLVGYQFFFVPDGKIDDNTTTIKVVDFFDADLLDDASHLLDLYSEIPAFVFLTTYHNRLVGGAEWADPTDKETFGNISVARVSYPGEYEAIDKVSGLIVTPLDSNPLTNGQEYRDVLYLFKKTRTYSYNDNGGDPSSWPLVIIDQGVGASVHGVASVLDSGGVNVDWLLIIDYSGVLLFNGAYQRPELSWKIKDYWFLLQRDDFKVIQIMNDSLSQLLYITLPNHRILFADYSNGLDPEKIRWCPWSFDNEVNTITLIDTNKLVIGSKSVLTP